MIEVEVVEQSPAEEWRAQMAGVNTPGRPYGRTRRFEIGDFVQHPGFGDGVVVRCSSGTICEVPFERGTIKLVMATQPVQNEAGLIR